MPRELQSLSEEFEENRGLEGSASDLAAVEINHTHPFDKNFEFDDQFKTMPQTENWQVRKPDDVPCSASSSQLASRKILKPKSLMLKQRRVSRAVEIEAHEDDDKISCSDTAVSPSEDPDQDSTDDEESCSEHIASPSEDTDDEDFRSEDVSPSSQGQYSLSTSASDFTEPMAYECADGRTFRTSKVTSEGAEIRRLGAAYRCH